MTIVFLPLAEAHFPLLLKWLEMPHVKEWWDKDGKWTEELIREKYGSYVNGFKRLELADKVIKKPIHAYIITSDNDPIGYIQYYDAYDFSREQGYILKELPSSLASIDLFIGEKEYIGKGYGPKIMDKFIQDYIFKDFDAVFVDPDLRNKGAIKAYEKSGFNIARELPDKGIVWMVKEKNNIRKGVIE
jgi:aminoglycoside 6'-N-acetyltransferase